MEIIEKAFKVWHSGMISFNPEEGYTMDNVPIVYAKTHGEAKSKSWEPYEFKLYDEDPKFTDLKVRREKGSDIIMFEGNKITRWQMEERISTQKRNDIRRSKIESYPDDTKFYIQNGYCGNYIIFWQDGGGYCSDIKKAEIFTKQQILNQFIGGREQDRIWEASHLTKNTNLCVDVQKLEGKFVA